MHLVRQHLFRVIGGNNIRHTKRFFAAQQDPQNKQSEDTNKSKDEEPNNRTRTNPPPPAMKQISVRGSFEDVSDKNRSTYLSLIELFETRNIHRRNHVEFIYAALKNMEPFGVHRDIEVYKALINVLPKGKFIPTNIIQAEFMHYPKQQQVIVDLLEQMEDNGICPDHEMQDILVNTFGRRGHPVRKYWRMMYWMPKFKNASPWLLPNPVTNEPLQLAQLAVQRMCTVDVQSTVQTYDTTDVADAVDHTWIVSGMSVQQAELLRQHSPTQPLHIEGPFLIWLRNAPVSYFTLRGDNVLPAATDYDDVDGEDGSPIFF